MKPTFKTARVTHLFTLFNALLEVALYAMDHADDTLSTILNVSMILIIARQRALRADIAAALVLIGGLAGHLAGTHALTLVMEFTSHPLLIAVATRIIVTEAVGWAVGAFATVIGFHDVDELRWQPSVRQILAATLLLLATRTLFLVIFESGPYSKGIIYFEWMKLFDSTPAMLCLIFGNLLLLHTLPRLHYAPLLQQGIGIAQFAVFSLVLTFLAYYEFPQNVHIDFVPLRFWRLYAVILLADVVTYFLLRFLKYVWDLHRDFRDTSRQEHLSQFRLGQLRQRSSAGWMSDALDTLAILLHEQQEERATHYLELLTSVHHYMRRHENRRMISLDEEVAFVRQYVELLKERYAEGLEVSYDIPEELFSRGIVPCGLQQLVENATRHNLINLRFPLTIRITAHGDTLTVSNNLQPKLLEPSHEGTGLKNLSQQYRDLSGRDIRIRRRIGSFTVTLPLLDELSS